MLGFSKQKAGRWIVLIIRKRNANISPPTGPASVLFLSELIEISFCARITACLCFDQNVLRSNWKVNFKFCQHCICCSRQDRDQQEKNPLGFCRHESCGTPKGSQKLSGNWNNTLSWIHWLQPFRRPHERKDEEAVWRLVNVYVCVQNNFALHNRFSLLSALLICGLYFLHWEPVQEANWNHFWQHIGAEAPNSVHLLTPPPHSSFTHFLN